MHYLGTYINNDLMCSHVFCIIYIYSYAFIYVDLDKAVCSKLNLLFIRIVIAYLNEKKKKKTRY